MPENIFLDGQGSFNHNTKNAGIIKWGEFNNAAVNTGSIVLSAVFTGSSVNSGTIGDLMPVYTVSVFQANSGNWESTYSTVAANSSTWGQGGGGSSDWDSITNKPSEFNPTTHYHHASSINAGVLDPARIPVINTSIQVISQGGLADLTSEQEDTIVQGALVTTTDGYRYVYTGGSKTSSASYIALADITPDWTVIANKPTEFNPASHAHTAGDITGLQSVMTWVTENSATNNNALGNSAYSLIVSNSSTWATIPDVSLGNEAYTIITANSSLWESGGAGSGASDWNSISNKPTEFAPSSHFHHASSINAGVLDPARIPVINTSIQVISQGGLADLTQGQQDTIVQGAIVTTTDGQRYVYVGGSKTVVGSYIALADITPDWNVIANKPTTFNPSSHTHAVSEVTGLQPVVTWVAQNSAATPSIINYLFDNGNSKVSLNSRGTITLPTNFSITEWKIVADVATTTVITLNKASFDSFPTMTSLGTVSVTNNRKGVNLSPGFSNLSADDILEFIVSANSDATKLTISLKGYKI
jgi:ligand-binding SRPBCC domain-containing protein